MVYIEEAHASDVWQLPVNIREKVVYASAKNFEERASVASSCVRNLKIQFPAIVDDDQNSTERAYTGWPDRMYLVDANGRIAYKSRPGPFGFKSAELAAALGNWCQARNSPVKR